MLTGLKVSSLVYKRVFHRPIQRGQTPWNINFDGLEIATDTAQGVDNKNGLICLVICLLPELRSLRCNKWLIYCIFYWWQQKVSHSLGKIFKWTWKILMCSFRNGMDNTPRGYRLWNIEGRNIKKAAKSPKMPKFWIFKGWAQ